MKSPILSNRPSGTRHVLEMNFGHGGYEESQMQRFVVTAFRSNPPVHSARKPQWSVYGSSDSRSQSVLRVQSTLLRRHLLALKRVSWEPDS